MTKTSYWLKKFNIKLKKKYGQNFLAEDTIAKKIVKEANIKKEDFIIEIGTGAGTLSEEIIQKANNFISFEIDTSLKELLEERFCDKNKIDIVFEDFLSVDISKYDNKKPIYLANIPYNISSPILEKIFLETPNFKRAYLMVQKEFGERILGLNKKDFSPLTVFSQYFCDVRSVLEIPKGAFIPNPKIDSLVIEFKPHKKYNLESKDFMKFVKSCFSMRRKTIKNNLKRISNNPDDILESLNIDPKNRPEDLSVENYVDMYKKIKKS
jgi:16S rRNA (adenine1518-N6/adenine1519-N6)-dimethyltransferase